MNKKGFIDLSGLGLMSLGPQASGFICVAAVLIAISQLPAVKDDFRAKKAVGVCNSEELAADCDKYVSSLTKDEVLDLIRDDEVPIKRLNYGNLYTAPKDSRLAELK